MNDLTQNVFDIVDNIIDENLKIYFTTLDNKYRLSFTKEDKNYNGLLMRNIGTEEDIDMRVATSLDEYEYSVPSLPDMMTLICNIFAKFSYDSFYFEKDGKKYQFSVSR